jgi:transcriptional regulator
VVDAKDQTMTIFNNAQILEMRELYAAGATQAELGKRFGTRQTNVSKIVSGQTHKDAPGPITQTGRASGERHPLRKLTTQQVQDIRLYRELGMSYREIADTFGVSPGQVRSIALGEARVNG